MAEAMEGIMGLPQSQGSAELMQAASNPLLQSFAQSNPKQLNRELNASLSENDPRMMAQLRAELASLDLTQDEIDSMQMIIDYLLNNPDEYAQARQEMLADGMDEDLFPVNYDPVFLQAFAMALTELETQNASMGKEPMRMADGGLASLGRGGDTMLAHINPQEAALLKSVGGMGTTNPYTGLPEYGFFSKAWKAVTKPFKAVAKAVKSVLKSPIGRIVATIGLSMVLGPAVTGFLGPGVSSYVATGITAGLSNTAVNLASGMSFGDALKGGVTAGLMAGVGDYALGKLTGPAIEGGAPVYDANGQLVAPSGTPVTQGLQPVQAGGNAIQAGGSSTLSGAAPNATSYFSEELGFLTPDEVMNAAIGGVDPNTFTPVFGAAPSALPVQQQALCQQPLRQLLQHLHR